MAGWQSMPLHRLRQDCARGVDAAEVVRNLHSAQEVVDG